MNERGEEIVLQEIKDNTNIEIKMLGAKLEWGKKTDFPCIFL